VNRGSRKPAEYPNLRILAARLLLTPGARRREMEKLFARTATAFYCPVPPREVRGARGRLREYALFTRNRAEAALHAGGELRTVDSRLFGAARTLGNGYRLRLKVRGTRDAMAAARLIYRNLGIDFRGSAEGKVVIRQCAFAAVYTPRVCALMSALDRGLLAGLTGNGALEFRQRITEGADSCRACFREGTQ
jgi:hypothetical protein